MLGLWVSEWEPSFRKNLHVKNQLCPPFQLSFGCGSATASDNPKCLPHILLSLQCSIPVLAQAEATELWQVIIKLVSGLGSHLETWWLMCGLPLGVSVMLGSEVYMILWPYDKNDRLGRIRDTTGRPTGSTNLGLWGLNCQSKSMQGLDVAISLSHICSICALCLVFMWVP